MFQKQTFGIVDVGFLWSRCPSHLPRNSVKAVLLLIADLHSLMVWYLYILNAVRCQSVTVGVANSVANDVTMRMTS